PQTLLRPTRWSAQQRQTAVILPPRARLLRAAREPSRRRCRRLRTSSSTGLGVSLAGSSRISKHPAIRLEGLQYGGQVLLVSPPSCNRSCVNGAGHVLVSGRVELLAPALFIETHLVFVPVEADELRYAAPLPLEVGNRVLIAHFQPGKTLPFPDGQPDIHQV